MIPKIIVPFVFIFFLLSCTEKKERPTTAIDTGREFIRASLNGNFEIAEPLVLEDSLNMGLFNSFKMYYKKLPNDKKQHYKDASYNINKYLDLNDSVTIINYSNDYMNKPMDIKVVKTKNNWWIDFKYTYSGNLPID
jgi:hypothetical protein